MILVGGDCDGTTFEVHAAAEAGCGAAVLAKRKTVSQVCRELGVSETGFARWRESALAGMELGLSGKAVASARERELEARLADAEQMLGRVVAENELRCRRCDG